MKRFILAIYAVVFILFLAAPSQVFAQARGQNERPDFRLLTTNARGLALPGSIHSVQEVGNHIYYAGQFNQVIDAEGRVFERTCVFQWNKQTQEVTDWQIPWEEPSQVVHQIIVHEDTIFLAGGFFGLGPHRQNSLAAVDRATGEVKPWIADLINHQTVRFPVAEDIKLVQNERGQTFLAVVGQFIAIRDAQGNTYPHFGFATLDLETAQPYPVFADFKVALDPQYAAWPKTIEVRGNRIFIGGQFKHIYMNRRETGVARNGILSFRLFHHGAYLDDWNPNPNSDQFPPACYPADPNHPIYDPDAPEYNPNVPPYDANDWRFAPDCLRRSAFTGVNSIEFDQLNDDQVFLAGAFNEISGMPAMSLARVNLHTAVADPLFNPELHAVITPNTGAQAQSAADIWDILQVENALFIRGNFRLDPTRNRQVLATALNASNGENGYWRPWNIDSRKIFLGSDQQVYLGRLGFSIVLRGDANENGQLDFSDAIQIIQYSMQYGETTIPQHFRDRRPKMNVNNDWLINLDDGLYLLNHLLFAGPHPAP